MTPKNGIRALVDYVLLLVNKKLAEVGRDPSCILVAHVNDP